MFTEKQLFFMICESPLHAGSGNELDFIDMPIQRERHTGFPKIESSTLKGALRERFYTDFGVKDASNNYIHPESIKFDVAFGAMSKQPLAGDERQGALAFTDARLLLFPVKSMKGVFAWITCPFVLKQLERDMKRCDTDFKIEGNYIPVPNGAIVSSDNNLEIPGDEYNHIILEEYPYLAEAASPLLKIGSDSLNTWLATKVFDPGSWWHNHLKHNLVILGDNDFADFTEMSTEVITRNRINPDTGTVASGALFTEEYLPTDSVLYSLALAHDEFIADAKLIKNGTVRPRVTALDTMTFFKSNMTSQFGNTLRAGGNETIGKGLLRTTFI